MTDESTNNHQNNTNNNNSAQVEQWLANKLVGEWSALNLAPLLTKSSLGTLVDEAWSTLDAQLKLRFLFALPSLRARQLSEFGHLAQQILALATADADDWVRSTALLLSAFVVAAPNAASSPDAVSAADSLAQMERDSPDFAAIVAQVAEAWSSNPPHAVPLEFAYLDPSVLGESGRRLVADATRPSLHFRTPDALDAALAAAMSNAPGSTLGATASAAGGPARPGAVLSRSSADVRSIPRPSAAASSSTSARPAMFAPKRQHPSLASAIASRAPVAPKHKVMIISNDERARLVTAPDKELAREEKQAQKQAEKTQKIKEREEKRQRRDEEKLEQKQARDAVRLLEKASKVTKKRKQPHALAAGMGDLLAAGQQDSDDDDDNDDEDDDAADAGDDANDVAVTNTAYRGDFDGGAKTVSGFMSFANASTSAPQFPSAAAASVPTAGDSLTRADELSKMLESVLMNRPAQSAPTQQPAAQSAAAALAGLAPTWPPQQPAEAQASGSQEGQLQAMLTSVFEDADMNLVSAVQHQRIRQFLGGNRTNPDPSSPVHSIVLRKSIKDDQEVTLFVELNYETATWRKVSRRKRLAGPTPTPMAQ